MNRTSDGLQNALDALESLIPSSLDEVIRRNRDRARLYFSTPEELAALAACSDSVFGRHIKGVLRDWTLVTLNIVDKPGVILLGYNTTVGQTWATSLVTGIAGNRVLTRSGSLYQLDGPSSDDPDLLHLCAQIWNWGLGNYLGVPHIFY